MKKLIILSALALSACVTAPNPSGMAGVKILGNGLYQVSEMGFNGGSVAEQANKYCISQGGKKLAIVGNTTQSGLYSGRTYPVMIFRCDK